MHRDEHVVFVYECQVNRLARHVRDDITTLVGLRRDGRISVRLPRHRHLPLVERRTAENNVRVYFGQSSSVGNSDRRIAVRVVRVGHRAARRNDGVLPVRSDVLRMGSPFVRRRPGRHRAADHSVAVPAPARQHQRCQYNTVLVLCYAQWRF